MLQIFALMLALAGAGTRQVAPYALYDYSETGKEYRLAIPAGLKVVRGLLVVCNYAGGDSRDYYKQNWNSEYLEMHGFAFVGSRGNNSHRDSYQTFLRGLGVFANESRHPEIVNAPWATTGFSAGGGFASRLLTEAPDRVIACAPVGARINFDVFVAPDAPTAAHLSVPTCLITGELEHSEKVVDPVFVPYRPRGALFSWLAVQARGHEMCGQQVLAMPFLDAVTRLRYPQTMDPRHGPVKLLPIKSGSGWVADNTSWKTAVTLITPAKEFAGDVGHSSWLPTSDIAFVYRAYSTYNRRLKITSPEGENGDHAYECSAGSDVTITLETGSVVGLGAIQLYDGATRICEVAPDHRTAVAPRLTAGYHVFTVMGTDKNGVALVSNPVLVVARHASSSLQ